METRHGNYYNRLYRFGDSGLGFRRNGKEHGNFYNGLYRDYYKDPFLHSQLTKGNIE